MLDDTKHVEAIALMKAVLKGDEPAVLRPVITWWVRENEPSLEVELSALNELHGEYVGVPDGE